jgi:NTE family protein
MRIRSPIVVLFVAAAMSGCAAYTRTPRLSAYDLSKGYRFEQLPLSPAAAPPRNADELFVVLAFSGGGTRAAALSYGVLAQLREVKFHWNPETGQAEACDPPDAPRCRAMERSLLDEVDVISSVSGGSFTSAYYALRGDGIFDPAGPFHRAFLYYPVQRDLLAHAVYYPQNWVRLRSRVEIAANDYSKNVFGGATFADLQRRSRPYLILNATDASTGARFEFTQEQFDLLCADLSAVPIARGVAASSAFPGLLNSMTIDSYNKAGCGYTGPGTQQNDWVDLAMRDAFVNYRRYTAARQTLAYRDSTRTHLHLLDGGLADNIGLRSVLQSLTSTDRPIAKDASGQPVLGGWSLLSKINNHQVKTIVVVTVNARTNKKKNWDTKKAGPGTFTVINSASGAPMGNFSTETLELLREYGADAALNEPGAPRFYGVEVAFENLGREDEREFLGGMGTNFELQRFEVDCLIDRGATLLRESTSVTEDTPVAFTEFVSQTLKGAIGTPATPHPAECTSAAGKRHLGTRGHYVDVGLQYNVSRARSHDVKDDHGVGVAVRAVKPNGFGVTVGFGTNPFDVPGSLGATTLTVGTLNLRTLSGGVFYAVRRGRAELSAGGSLGYGFAGFDIADEARDAYARLGYFAVSADATDAFVLKPDARLWYNVTDRIAGTVSVSYTHARSTIRFDGTDTPDRAITAAAVRLSAGVALKVF